MENLASGISAVQQFSFQRDGIEKLAVPNWLQGLVRPNISWHISVTDQQTFNSMVHTVAKMTSRKPRVRFCGLKKVFLHRAFTTLLPSSASTKLHLGRSFEEWRAKSISNDHYHLCLLPRAGLGDHSIPITGSQAATFGLAPLALHPPFSAQPSLLSKLPPKGLGVSTCPHSHWWAFSLSQPQVLNEEEGEGKSSNCLCWL